MERSNTKDIVSKVAYLIGVKKTILYNQFETERPGFLQEMNDHQPARTIRSLCKLRMTLLHRFKKVDDMLRFELKNLKTIEFFDKNDIIQLEKWGIPVTQVNFRSSLYMEHFNNLIQEHIDDCKELFPDWLKWEYLRSLFLMPKNKKTDIAKSEFAKYMGNMEYYPYQAYIYWQPKDCGNMLFNDQKFVSILYDMNDDYFAEDEKVLAFQSLELHVPANPLIDFQVHDPKFYKKKERRIVAATIRKMQAPNHDAAVFDVSGSPLLNFPYTFTPPINPTTAPMA